MPINSHRVAHIKDDDHWPGGNRRCMVSYFLRTCQRREQSSRQSENVEVCPQNHVLRFRDTANVKTGKTQATLINFGRAEDKYTMDSTRATGANSTMNAAMSTTHMIFDMPAPTNADSGLDAISANAHTGTPRQIRARKIRMIRMKDTSHAQLSDICSQNFGR